jgi:hypothetical protein
MSETTLILQARHVPTFGIAIAIASVYYLIGLLLQLLQSTLWGGKSSKCWGQRAIQAVVCVVQHDNCIALRLQSADCSLHLLWRTSCCSPGLKRVVCLLASCLLVGFINPAVKRAEAASKWLGKSVNRHAHHPEGFSYSYRLDWMGTDAGSAWLAGM